MANLLASGAYWRCDGDCQERAGHARKQTVWQGRHRGCALSEEDSHPLKTLISVATQDFVLDFVLESRDIESVTRREGRWGFSKVYTLGMAGSSLKSTRSRARRAQHRLFSAAV